MRNTLPVIIPQGRYNKAEACRLLGISRYKLENAINKNLIRTYLHDYEKRIYVKGEDLITYYNALSELKKPEPQKISPVTNTIND